MTSHFVVPERLQSEAKKNPGARIEIYPETANLPMDIVVRMDLSDPLPPKVIKINSSEIIDYYSEENDPVTTTSNVSEEYEEED
jgi:hypothetical protein